FGFFFAAASNDLRASPKLPASKALIPAASSADGGGSDAGEAAGVESDSDDAPGSAPPVWAGGLEPPHPPEALAPLLTRAAAMATARQRRRSSGSFGDDFMRPHPPTMAAHGERET